MGSSLRGKGSHPVVIVLLGIIISQWCMRISNVKMAEKNEFANKSLPSNSLFARHEFFHVSVCAAAKHKPEAGGAEFFFGGLIHL